MDDRALDNLYSLLFYPSSNMCQDEVLAHAEVRQTPEGMNECAVINGYRNPFAEHMLWARHGASCWWYSCE